MGLVLFLADQLVGGLAEPFNGFQFLPHGLYVDGVRPVVLPSPSPIRDALTVLVQVVCLAALRASCAIIFQGQDSQHDINIGLPVPLLWMI